MLSFWIHIYNQYKRKEKLKLKSNFKVCVISVKNESASEIIPRTTNPVIIERGQGQNSTRWRIGLSTFDCFSLGHNGGKNMYIFIFS